jgi:hypothetical protein
MRTTATGFLIAYVVVGLFIMPSLLWAVHATPNYMGGVAMVLESTGVSRTLEWSGQELVTLRDRLSQEVTADFDKLMGQRRRN